MKILLVILIASKVLAVPQTAVIHEFSSMKECVLAKKKIYLAMEDQEPTHDKTDRRLECIKI